MSEQMSRTASDSGALSQVEAAAPSALTDAEAEALALSGSRSVAFADRLARQVALCQPLPADEAGRAHRTAAATAALKELTPQSGLEGMLAGQMVAAHNVAMALTAQGFYGQTPLNTELFLRQGLRAMTVFARQMELMTRQRGRRRQSLRIEHEHRGEDGRVSLRAEEERVR
jgi:hypothetical protein